MRILIVEDDPKQLMPLQTVLSQAGHSVDGVKDGETAQWLLSEKEFDTPRRERTGILEK
jgi:DNA-binding response OmpR family regulator